MQITKLEINRYKNLRFFSESFERGINLLKGPNEAGKSSLVDAITDLLFSDPSSTKKDLKDKIGWDSDKSFELIMEFAIEGDIYRLRKDFDSGDMILKKLSSGEDITDRKKIMAIIESGLGMANQEIYLATTTIRQDEIGRVSRSSEAIKDKLEGMITAGREEVLASEAISKIENESKNIKKEGTRHFGVIQKLEKNRNELIYELDKAKREIDQIGKNRAKLKETKALLDGIRIEYATKKSHMEKAAKAAENEEKLKDLEERFQDLNNRVKSVQSSEAVLEELKKELGELPVIQSTDLKMAEDQSAQIKYLENKHESAEEKTEGLAEKLALAKPPMVLKVSALFMLLLSLASGAYWYFILNMADNRFIFGAVGGLVVFIVLALIWGSKSGHAREVRVQYSLKKAALEELESDVEDAKSSIEEVLSRYHTDDIHTLRTKFEQYRDLEKEIKNEVRRHDSWLNGKPINDLEKELATVTKDLAVESENSRELKIYVMNAEEKEKLGVLVEALEKQKANLEATEIALKRQLEFAESGCELQASLEERLEEIDTSISRAKYQLQVYDTVKEYIEKARKNVLKASIGVLEEETSKILENVTGGRYNRVRFDRQSLRFEVFSTVKDDWIDPDMALSRGTRDQLYLAARMALVRIISQDRKPVLIFDEPFLTFDSERRKNALEILKQYSDNYQIFVLTCHEYYDGCAEKSVDMDPVQKAQQPVNA